MLRSLTQWFRCANFRKKSLILQNTVFKFMVNRHNDVWNVFFLNNANEPRLALMNHTMNITFLVNVFEFDIRISWTGNLKRELVGIYYPSARLWIIWLKKVIYWSGHFVFATHVLFTNSCVLPLVAKTKQIFSIRPINLTVSLIIRSAPYLDRLSRRKCIWRGS